MMPGIGELRQIFLTGPSRVPVLYLPAYGDDGFHRHAERPALDHGLGPCAVAIGAFDGMHVGHRSLLASTVRAARAAGIAAYAVTFDPDPDEVVAPHPAKRLLTLEQRLGRLASSGVDGVLVIPFTRELAALDHAAFFERVLFPMLDVRQVHVGSDFRLGHRGASTVAIMRPWLQERGIALTGHDLVAQDGSTVSATRIRSALAATHVEEAARELGRAYMVEGPVRAGQGKGTGMGFPTANIDVDPSMQMPGDGVYAGLALIGRSVYAAAVNVGVPPMFKDEPGACPLEAHVIGYEGDLYHERVSLAFTSFLRPSVVFDSDQELIDTVLGNIASIREAYGAEGVSIALAGDGATREVPPASRGGSDERVPR